MASAIMHISVAKRINEKLKVDEKLLFLGAIAPDLSKQLGLPKSQSHFTEKPNIPCVDKFLEKYKSELRNPFELGYLIHLMTDHYWYTEFFKNYVIKDRSIKFLNNLVIEQNAENIRQLIYTDYTNINISLITKYNLSLDLFSYEMKYPKSKITEIPMNEIDKIVEKVSIIIMNSQGEKNIVFPMEEIIEFIEESADKIIKTFKSLKII